MVNARVLIIGVLSFLTGILLYIPDEADVAEYILYIEERIIKSLIAIGPNVPQIQNVYSNILLSVTIARIGVLIFGFYLIIKGFKGENN